MLLRRLLSTLVASQLALAVTVASAEIAPDLSVRLACEVLPSLVLCRVLVQAAPQSHITYVQAEIVKSPPFLTPVKTRATYKEAFTVAPNLKLGLLPKAAGTGAVEVQVQAAVCTDAGTACRDFDRRLAAVVTVTR